MEFRTLRRVWFAGIWFLVPWPMLIMQDAFVPASRYAVLAGAATAIATMEGAAGPVAQLVGLFVGWAVGTSLLCWLLAWSLATVAARLPHRTARFLTLAILGTGLFYALVFEPYRTPFGRALRGGLLQVLS